MRAAVLLVLALVLAASAADGAEPVAAAPTARVVTLEEATSAALASHERIRAAAAEERRAGVAGLRAYSVLGPSIEEVGSWTRNKEGIAFSGFTPPGGGASDFNPVILQKEAARGVLTVEQPLYRHEFWAVREIGESEAHRAEQGSRVARQDVVGEVVEAYYDLLRARALAEVAAETEKLAGVEVTHAEDRVGAGEAVRSEVIRAQTETARAAQRVEESRGAIEVAVDRLARLTGLPRGFDVVEPPPRQVELTSADPYVAAARDRSPDLLRAEAALEAARAESRRRAALLLPTAGFQFHYRLIDNEAFAERNDFWDAVFAIRIPLLESGGSRWLDWREQSAAVERAEAEVAGLRRDVELRVRQAFVNARTLAAQEAAAEKQVSFAIETYRLLSEQYTAGVATGLDVLDALTDRDSARANLTIVHYARQVAVAALERATGVLGEEPVGVTGGAP